MIEIVNYEPKYRSFFKSLNKDWIDRYFKMEDADYKALDNPEKYIIQPGGSIIILLYDSVPAGVCALIKMPDSQYDYELAKMAVSTQYHGKGIGFILGKAVIDKAKNLNAKSIYLESNTILIPAINLYRKLGFTEVEGIETTYDRFNIQIELFF
jgi:GNAT superfamily N-acetyltransferase